MAPYPHARDGQRLRAARLEAGLKHQGDLAKILGTKRERVSGWETGRVRVGDDYRAKIKETLGLDLDADPPADPPTEVADQLTEIRAELTWFRSLLTRHGPESVATAIRTNVEVIPRLLRGLGKAIADIGTGVEDLQERLAHVEARLDELSGRRRAEPR